MIRINKDVPFRGCEDEVVRIEEYVDEVTFYRNGMVKISLVLGEPIYIDLDILSEIYPRKTH